MRNIIKTYESDECYPTCKMLLSLYSIQSIEAAVVTYYIGKGYGLGDRDILNVVKSSSINCSPALEKLVEFSEEQGEGMYVSEQEYKKFCEITKGFSDIETDSLTLQITLSNKKVLSLIKKWNEIADTSWACTSLQSPPHYFFERFEFLNLIPEVKPFSDEEIRFLIDNIKRSMIEAIKDL